MSSSSNTPSLLDFYRLRKQIEEDKSLSIEHLRARDHAIGKKCEEDNDVSRLVFWARDLSHKSDDQPGHMLSESTVTKAVFFIALFSGFFSMSGYLMRGEGAVNVFFFFLFFVALQVLFCTLSVWVVLRSLGESPPIILPINPTKYLVNKILPDKRFYRECESVVRILALRYGQEFGALFTLGALVAFYMTLKFQGFWFGWESTWGIGGVQSFVNLVSFPWFDSIPSAIVTLDVIEFSNNIDEQGFSKAEKISMTLPWAGFLGMSLAVYALLPRVVLWIVARLSYRKKMRESFIKYPGSERILTRMRAPLVTTRGDTSPSYTGVKSRTSVDVDAINGPVVNWAGAMQFVGSEDFEELRAIPADQVITAGMGSMSEDRAASALIDKHKVEDIVVLVKSWEPPMADLQDFLANLGGVKRASLYLLPAEKKQVKRSSLDDWESFSRGLSIGVVDVQPLKRPEQ